MQEGILIFKKLVDRSVLRQGFSIPVGYQRIVAETTQIVLCHGQKRDIKIIIDGEEFPAQMINQGFDQNKFKDHSDILQIRYSGAITAKLQSIFSATHDYILSEMGSVTGRRTIKIPPGREEYLALYTTRFKNKFVVDYITMEDTIDNGKLLKDIRETDYESYINVKEHDENAGVIERHMLVKVRQMDRSICTGLKKLYDYRCQITGRRTGEKYGCDVVEAHHIDYFTRSQNNDISNIIILSPNLHRIIHQTNAIFDRKRKAFVFPNGVVEKLQFNRHL